MVALGADVGPHPAQLLDVAEAAEEEVLGHDAHALGHGQQGDEQRLVVGGEARVGQGGHVGAVQPADPGRRGPQAVGLVGDLHAGGRQLPEQHVHVLGATVLDGHLATGQPGRHQEGGHHQPVGDDGVGGGLEPVDALHLDARRPGPA